MSGTVDQPDQSNVYLDDIQPVTKTITSVVPKSSTLSKGNTVVTVLGDYQATTTFLRNTAQNGGNYVGDGSSAFVVSLVDGFFEDSATLSVNGLGLPGLSQPITATQRAAEQKMNDHVNAFFQTMTANGATSFSNLFNWTNSAIDNVYKSILGEVQNFVNNTGNTGNDFINSLATAIQSAINSNNPTAPVALSTVTSALLQPTDSFVTDSSTDQTVITATSTGDEIFQDVNQAGTLMGTTLIEPKANPSNDMLYETLDSSGNILTQDFEHTDGTSTFVTYATGLVTSITNYTGSFGTGTATSMPVNVPSVTINSVDPTTSATQSITTLALINDSGTTTLPGLSGPLHNLQFSVSRWATNYLQYTITFPTSETFSSTSPILEFSLPANGLTISGVSTDLTGSRALAASNPAIFGANETHYIANWDGKQGVSFLPSGPSNQGWVVTYSPITVTAGEKFVLDVALNTGLPQSSTIPIPGISPADLYTTTPTLPPVTPPPTHTVTTSGPIGGTDGSIYNVATDKISVTINATNTNPVFIHGNGDSVTFGDSAANFTLTDDGQGTKFLVPFYNPKGVTISVGDFRNDKTGVLTLTDQFPTPQAVISAMKSDGHGGSILALNGGALKMDFLNDTSLTAANFRVGNL